jgi:hypothetical protein
MSRWVAHVALLLAPWAVACTPPRVDPPPPWAAHTSGSSLTGRVVEVHEQGGAPAAYVHLVVEPPGKKPVRVELGPGWFLDEHGLRFEPEQEVSVEAATVTRDGQSILVARSVRRGDSALELRDDEQRPLWSE